MQIDYSKITDDNYFDFPALNASGINAYYNHPLIFWLTSPLNPAYKPREKTDAMIFGNILHCLLLEDRSVFKARYIVTEKGLRRGTTKWREYEGLAVGRELVKGEDYENAKEIIDSLRENPVARTLLKDCQYEAPVTWDNQGMPCKMKIDAFKTSSHLIVDYKSTSETTEDGLRKSIANYSYHRSAAWYMDGYEKTRGVRPKGFIALFQNKEYPQLVFPVNIHPEAIEAGQYENEKARVDIGKRIVSGDWGIPKGIIDATLPDWYKLKGTEL
jgi:hypothetical protein